MTLIHIKQQILKENKHGETFIGGCMANVVHILTASHEYGRYVTHNNSKMSVIKKIKYNDLDGFIHFLCVNVDLIFCWK